MKFSPPLWIEEAESIFSQSFSACCLEVAAKQWHAGCGPLLSRTTGQDHYYFLQTLGRSAKRVATEFLHLAVKQIPVSQIGEFIKLALDDSPTKRYGPKVECAGTHHNPTPGPSGSEFLYGHVWVTISWLVNHPQWGCIGMPLLALERTAFRWLIVVVIGRAGRRLK